MKSRASPARDWSLPVAHAGLGLVLSLMALWNAASSRLPRWRRRRNVRAKAVLPEGALLAFRPTRGLCATCLRGTVWITQSGDPRDHVLNENAQWRSAKRGKVTFLALSDAEICVSLDERIWLRKRKAHREAEGKGLKAGEGTRTLNS